MYLLINLKKNLLFSGMLVIIWIALKNYDIVEGIVSLAGIFMMIS